MALSAQRVQEAKNEAETMLEYAILGIALSLGVSIDSIEDEYVNPVEMTFVGVDGNERPSQEYMGHENLSKHVAALTKLRAM